MEVQLTQEQTESTTEFSRDGDSSVHNHRTEYELDQSESLTFLYNLLYNDDSYLTKSDILAILNSLKLREESLPFSFNESNLDRFSDVQGVNWTNGLRNKFYSDRRRIGSSNWFHNIPGSLKRASTKTNITSFSSLTDMFKFNRFYSKLKLDITHFQLRNLVCCDKLSKGIFYPSSYYHDHNLEATNSFGQGDSVHSFFKINRLINDCESPSRDSMKLDCIIDSRTLLANSNSRISTLNCSSQYLVSGTFEGNYILTDISNTEEINHLGEFNLTNDYDGITNSIIINDNDNELIISSNDNHIRHIDLKSNSRHSIQLPYAGNCLALNKFNNNEVFVSADDTVSFVYDKRVSFDISKVQKFYGQEDHSFSCDWSPTDENLLLTGNQDGNVRLWDRRNGDTPVYCWSGGLGAVDISKTLRSKESKSNSSDSYTNCLSGPVRNTKFSHNGNFICWAESLDHVGLVNVNDLKENKIECVQSIDFIGKCTGLSFCETENGYGEQLLVGVNDCPLGGILSYNLESRDKCLDFDFYF